MLPDFVVFAQGTVVEPLSDCSLFGKSEEQRLKQAIVQPFFFNFLPSGLVGPVELLGFLVSEAAIERFRTRFWRTGVGERELAGGKVLI